MEQQILAWVSAHAITIFVAYFFFNLAVQALNRPTEKSSPVYVWAYRLLHLIALNVRLFASPLKGLPQPVTEEEQKPEQK